jgi:eukaryotic-like serine/threonine-protein kinase
MQTESPRYKAFVSYDDEDLAWGTWVQTELEAYAIPRELIGTQGSLGLIPRSLRPIFRDRSELPASSSYSESIQSFIDSSDHLIVICSPRSAKSTYVDDEIRRFKIAGKENRTLAIIVDGEPGDPERECFPPSLRYKVVNGSLTNEAAEPLAADARPHRDGKQLALMKIVAGLLGINLDDLVRREEVARRRRTRMWATIAAVMALLAVLATGSSVYAFKERAKANDRLATALNAAAGLVNQAVKLSETYGVPRRHVVELLNQADGTLRQLGEEATQDANFQFRRAQMLTAFAKTFEALGQTKVTRDRALQATQILDGLSSTLPDNDEYAQELVRSLAVLSEAELSSGDLAASEAAAKRSFELAERRLALNATSLSWRGHRCYARERLARIERDRGHLDPALDLLNASITERSDMLRSLAPETTQRDAGEIKRRLADVHMVAGDIWLLQRSDPAEARNAYTAAHQLLAELRRDEPNNAENRWFLANATAQIASSLYDEDKFQEALVGFLEAASIADELVASDAENAPWRAGQVRAYLFVADAQRGLGNTAEAENELTRLLALARSLAQRYPDNLERRTDIGGIQFRFGLLSRDRRDFAGCVTHATTAVATFETAVASSPGNESLKLSRDKAADLRDLCVRREKG